MSHVDWARHPAIVVWSDDWNMCAWGPDRRTYEALRGLPLMQTPWSAGTLETAAETEALFDVIRRHRGADGRLPVFEGYYVVGNPDYDAIAAAGFHEYIDIGIDEGVPENWERGPFLETARSGISEGIWCPAYHHRTHHFSGVAWVRRLRDGEALARRMFGHQMYVCESVADRTRENDQPGPEPFSWIRVGVERFKRAFGYTPHAIRNGEQDDEPVAAAGIRTYVNVRDIEGCDATGRRSDAADLFYLGRCVNFEPFMTADEEDVVERVYAQLQDQLQAGMPARLSTHRRNFVSFADDVPRNLELLDALLRCIQERQPEAVYLTSDEVRQLWETGVSLRMHGATLVIRNWAEPADQPRAMALPRNAHVGEMRALRRFTNDAIDVSTDGTCLHVPPGDYEVTLARSPDQGASENAGT